MKKLIIIALAFCSIQINAQGLKTPAKSPLASVKQAVGLGDVSIEYSRPSKSGRTVFGDVVPFGELWRTGANASTKMTFTEDVKVNGQALKAGTYAVFTIPNKEDWTIIFNKNLTLWGSDGYSENEDAARILVKTQKISDLVETFTIQFTNTKTTQLTTEFTWENTKVSFDITVDIDEKLMKNIEAAMAQDKRPYHQSAQYYYDNKKDMNKALEWATKAFELNPSAYWSGLLKAKIQFELNDKKGAIATAEQVKKLAEEDKDPAYVKQAEELIQKAKAK
jgi:tetratricopeptide (TPR) repeat protein